MLRHWKRFLPLGATLGIMGAVLANSDWRDVATRFASLERRWLVAALALFGPLVLGSALRWRAMVRPWCRLSVREACAHVLAAAALNLALPSKLGDFSKAAFLRDHRGRAPHGARNMRDGGNTGRAVRGPGLVQASAVVVAEKAIDLFALVVLLMAGLVLEGHGGLVFGMTAAALSVAAGLGTIWFVRAPYSSQAPGMIAIEPNGNAGRPRPQWRQLARAAMAPLVAWRRRLVVFVLWSWVLWSIHLTQMALLFRTAGIEIPFEHVLARVPLAVVAGLVPWTVAGIGTRDSALLVLFSDTAPAAALAVVGMLTALRYLVPGTLGLPILYRRLASAERRTVAPAHQRLDVPGKPVVMRETRVPMG